MSFASPFVLWGLLLIPIALLGYWLVQRRRIKYAARFTNLDLLVNVVDATPGRRRHVPALLVLTALAALVVAMARPQAVVAVPARGGDGRPDHGQLGVDDRHGRRAEPARGGEVGGLDVPRRGPGPLPRRPGRVLELGAGPGGADRGP